MAISSSRLTTIMEPKGTVRRYPSPSCLTNGWRVTTGPGIRFVISS